MTVDIKKIEDLSLNAWPSHQMEVYDGWILRFSYFYTHRTNCAEPIGYSILPMEEKVKYCEDIYRRWGTPCIFKISPITDPGLDNYLEGRGYHIEHSVDVMTAQISDCRLESPFFDLTVGNKVSTRWISGLFALKHTVDPVHRQIVPSMYAAIPKDEIAVSFEYEGEIAATGLGILDRDYIGIYAIHVWEDLRRKGLARAIVTTLLTEGKKRGANYAYLQAVSDNAPAKNLYRSIGFDTSYRCWFRVK